MRKTQQVWLEYFLTEIGKILSNCKILQLEQATLDKRYKIESDKKVNVDISNKGGYHMNVRMLTHDLPKFVNNITQPGKFDKEEKT